MQGGRTTLAAVLGIGLLLATSVPRAGAAVVVTPGPLQRYREAHEKYRARIAAFSAEKHVGHASVPTSHAWDDAVLGILRRSNVVK